MGMTLIASALFAHGFCVSAIDRSSQRSFAEYLPNSLIETDQIEAPHVPAVENDFQVGDRVEWTVPESCQPKQYGGLDNSGKEFKNWANRQIETTRRRYSCWPYPMKLETKWFTIIDSRMTRAGNVVADDASTRCGEGKVHVEFHHRKATNGDPPRRYCVSRDELKNITLIERQRREAVEKAEEKGKALLEALQNEEEARKALDAKNAADAADAVAKQRAQEKNEAERKNLEAQIGHAKLIAQKAESELGVESQVAKQAKGDLDRLEKQAKYAQEQIIQLNEELQRTRDAANAKMNQMRKDHDAALSDLENRLREEQDKLKYMTQKEEAVRQAEAVRVAQEAYDQKRIAQVEEELHSRIQQLKSVQELNDQVSEELRNLQEQHAEKIENAKSESARQASAATRRDLESDFTARLSVLEEKLRVTNDALRDAQIEVTKAREAESIAKRQAAEQQENTVREAREAMARREAEDKRSQILGGQFFSDADLEALKCDDLTSIAEALHIGRTAPDEIMNLGEAEKKQLPQKALNLLLQSLAVQGKTNTISKQDLASLLGVGIVDWDKLGANFIKGNGVDYSELMRVLYVRVDPNIH